MDERTKNEYSLYRDLVAAQEELGIANTELERMRRILDRLSAWTTLYGKKESIPPSHCADTYAEGVREMKDAVRRILRDVTTE